MDDHPPGSERTPIASLDDRFAAQLARSRERAAGKSAYPPAAVAHAVAGLLDVDGVSLSIATDGARLPLAASSPQAALAESLQFTSGNGPCLAAMHDGVVVDASADRLTRDWPLFADLLDRHTDYHSAAAVPVDIDPTIGCSLNLFFVHDRGAHDVTEHQVSRLGTLVSGELSRWARHARAELLLALVAAPRAARDDTWVAVGMAMARFDVSGIDALDLLRAYAVAHDLTVDDAGAQIVAGLLDVGVIGD